MRLYIGLLSGTSLDAVDAALVEMDDTACRLRQHYSLPVPSALRQQALALLIPGKDELARLARLDVQLGRLFADAAQALLKQAGLDAPAITAIGSHGQTLRHFPDGDWPTSVQIGDPNIIAERTGITTVADFRRRDMAAGGQGAPLAPAFHQAMLRDENHDRVVVNIGGIANLTLLPRDPDIPASGFDCGPGNGLMDAWIEHHRQLPMDENGEWAAGGRVNEDLLEALLADAYFTRPPPKSTGREYFNRQWLENILATFPALPARDVQATLAELTAASIARAIEEHAPASEQVLICGGGVHNADLLHRLSARLPGRQIASTRIAGVDPDWMEAMAFAWLAKQTLEGKPGNLPSVTGARHGVVLGAVYFAV